jgi:predicted transport protein
VEDFKMLASIFTGLFDTEQALAVDVTDFLICILSSLVIGFVIALMYMYKSTYSKSFIVTLATLPAVVCVVIMMVNGNVGAGVAVAGAFSLVRFRSVPGTAKEIGVLFMAMGAGLITGMGYIAYGFAFVIIMGIVYMVYAQLDFGTKKQTALNKTLRVTIPEDLDYTDVFDDIFEKYADKAELVNVKTTNMGSLFKLTYNVKFKEMNTEKNFIDEIRCRNGNLEITMSSQENSNVEML